MSNFCKCCDSNDDWVSNHIDPMGSIQFKIKSSGLTLATARLTAQSMKYCFDKPLTDLEITAIELYIITSIGKYEKEK